jgi:DNA-binding CsgD family transcriptional regulator/transposase
MALPNGNFKGKYNNKGLYDFRKLVDYSIEGTMDRLELVRGILGIVEENGIEFTDEKFWREVWDTGVCKSELNTTDITWSETNVAKFLEQLGTYLIMAYEKEVDIEETIYDSNSEQLLAKKDERVATRLEEVVEKDNKNYKLKPKFKVDNKDLHKYPDLLEYHKYKEYLRMLRDDKVQSKKLSDMLQEHGIPYTPEKVWYFAKDQMAKLTDDMTQMKLSLERPITFKMPLKDAGCPDWEELDMFDPNHVMELLRVHKGNDLQDDISCIVMDLENIIKKVEFTEQQAEVLELHRRDKSLVDIADILDISPKTVKGHLTSCVRLIIKEYERQYSDWYYLNIAKGQYRQCSKCGKVKLTSEYSKKGDRLHSQCKECQRTT